MQLLNRVNDTFPFLIEGFFDSGVFDVPLQKKYENNMSTLPLANISDTEEEYLISLIVPGVDKKDMCLQIDNNVLEVSYSTSKDESEDKSHYTHKEFSLHSFNRSFTLPRGRVDHQAVKADYLDGVLHIHLPKVEEKKSKEKRVIEIV